MMNQNFFQMLRKQLTLSPFVYTDCFIYKKRFAKNWGGNTVITRKTLRPTLIDATIDEDFE